METYLNSIIPGLHAAGHDLAFWSELDQPADREPITLPSNSPAWCVSGLGAECALTALREWCPDMIYSSGLLEPELERKTLAIAPAVFLALNYYGTCISGAKTFKFPVVTPCSRRFGWQCLTHYYPHRCGGLSPGTMLREYRRQSERSDLLRSYKAIVTLSAHMAAEYTKHGLPADSIYVLPPPVCNGSGRPVDETPRVRPVSPSARTLPVHSAALTTDLSRSYWALLFLGRMDFLKGGRLFLEALPQVASSLDRPLRVTFAGDGPERSAWERQAASVKDKKQRLTIEFVGWLEGREREALLADSDLLIMPSLWPEPFGLSGPEAGLHGVPAVAFAVGGIPEWLQDGVNGFLAAGNPPTVAGLSEAIVRALRDTQTYARLCQGALERAQEHTVHVHLAQLLPLLERYAR